MRLAGYILVITASLFWYVESCDPNQTQNGCKIYGSECLCGFGCKTEYVYGTRRACLSALRGCSLNQIHYGCLIKESVCRCGFGCKNEYKYRTRRICISALRLNRTRVCYKSCVHGVCIPTDAGYVCNCNGTNHFGDHCEKACPGIEANGENIPRFCGS